jgi:nitrogen fixation-related uncharacterized protein
LPRQRRKPLLARQRRGLKEGEPGTRPGRIATRRGLAALDLEGLPRLDWSSRPALERGELAGAGLDVFEQEPQVHEGLLDRDDVVLIPHLGSATVETRTAMATLAARNALAILAGLAWAVWRGQFDALDAEGERILHSD